MIRTALVGLVALVAGCAPVVAESVPAETAGCVLTETVVVVELDPVDHAGILDHVADAIEAGHPAMLTIERDGADQRREDATDDYPTRDGMDRDEYPPAMSAEGGEGSSVRHIDSSENRSAGAVLGNQLEPYCDNQNFRIGD